jgi:hypothetical protein
MRAGSDAAYNEAAGGQFGAASNYGNGAFGRAHQDAGARGYRNAGDRGDRAFERHGSNDSYDGARGSGARSAENYGGHDRYAQSAADRDAYNASSAEAYGDAAFENGKRGDQFGGAAAAAAYKAGYEKDIDRKWGGFDSTKIRYGESGAKADEAHNYGGGSAEDYGARAGAAGERASGEGGSR